MLCIDGAGRDEEGKYLGYGHRASDGAYAVTDGSQEANLHAVDRLVEFLDLLLLGRVVIPLVGDCGIRLGIDMGCFEFSDHLEGWCCGKGSWCGKLSGEDEGFLEDS